MSMMDDKSSKFQRHSSTTQQRRLALQFKRKAWLGPPSDVRASAPGHKFKLTTVKTIYGGISSNFENNHTKTIAIAIRDTTYLLDFIEKQFEKGPLCASEATDFILAQLKSYSEEHLEKIVGVSMPEHIADRCPTLCPRLWAELDIIPLVMSNAALIDRMSVGQTSDEQEAASDGWVKTVDEQAESMARKGVRFVGRNS